jgi:hypothetical protein
MWFGGLPAFAVPALARMHGPARRGTRRASLTASQGLGHAR